MKLIACEIIAAELKPYLLNGVEPLVLDASLHVSPDNLRRRLQQAICEIEEQAKQIVLGYGLCSCAVEGLVSQKAELIIPRVDDCTGILLGSRKEYLRQQAGNPGTYYLSPGWIQANSHLFAEFSIMKDRFGEKRALSLMQSMIRHYSRLAYISGVDFWENKKNEKYCEVIAKQFGLSFESLKGSSRLFKKIIKRKWDEDFVVFAPGVSVDRWCFFDELDAKAHGDSKEVSK